jgi:acetylornithine deacetylase/succinyl-diaminopimelate desuccinylase-like protein
MSEAAREALAQIEIDAGPAGPAIDPDWGEPGLTPSEKAYGSSSCNVLACVTGTPDRPVNAIPPKARAHCQLRYVYGVDDDDVIPALRRHLEAHGFQRVSVEAPPPANSGSFRASRTEPDHPWALWAQRSMQRTLDGQPAVVPSMGGSICNDIFTDLLGQPAIWIPHSYAGCSQHAPDEHVLLSVCRSAMHVMAGVYWDLGAGDTP